MSTGQKYDNEISFEDINAYVNQYGPTLYTSETIAPQTPMDRIGSLITSYTVARPIVVALSLIPLIPATWRATLNLFVISLDGVTASFKAGKDLAVGNSGTTVEMEPKLPTD